MHMARPPQCGCRRHQRHDRYHDPTPRAATRSNGRVFTFIRHPSTVGSPQPRRRATPDTHPETTRSDRTTSSKRLTATPEGECADRTRSTARTQVAHMAVVPHANLRWSRSFEAAGRRHASGPQPPHTSRQGTLPARCLASCLQYDQKTHRWKTSLAQCPSVSLWSTPRLSRQTERSLRSGAPNHPTLPLTSQCRCGARSESRLRARVGGPARRPRGPCRATPVLRSRQRRVGRGLCPFRTDRMASCCRPPLRAARCLDCRVRSRRSRIAAAKSTPIREIYPIRLFRMIAEYLTKSGHMAPWGKVWPLIRRACFDAHEKVLGQRMSWAETPRGPLVKSLMERGSLRTGCAVSAGGCYRELLDAAGDAAAASAGSTPVAVALTSPCCGVCDVLSPGVEARARLWTA